MDTQPTIKLALLTEFLFNQGFRRLIWCGGKMTCYTSNNLPWTDKEIHKNSQETGDKSLEVLWKFVEASLEGHGQPFTLIMGAHTPEKEKS